MPQRMDPVRYDERRYELSQAEMEDQSMKACIQVAQVAGHSAEEAEECNDGEWDCPGCPWGGKQGGVK